MTVTLHVGGAGLTFRSWGGTGGRFRFEYFGFTVPESFHQRSVLFKAGLNKRSKHARPGSLGTEVYDLSEIEGHHDRQAVLLFSFRLQNVRGNHSNV